MTATVTTRVFSFFCGVALCAVVFGVSARAVAQTEVITPPVKSSLLPVHLPDVAKLEPEVRQHLLSAERALAATINDRRTTAPQLADAYGLLGQVFHAYSLNAAARECYLNAGTLAPRDFRWIHLLGKLDQDADRVEEAIRRFKVVRALRPDYLAAMVNLGNIYLQLNRVSEARQSYYDALAIDRNNPAAHYGLGQVALSERDYGEAVRRFGEALKQAPGANRIHYSLAMAYRGLGNTELAKSHLALQGTVGVRVIDPLMDKLPELIAGERLHLVRGKLALASNRSVEAVSEFQKALHANPESLEAHVNLGAALTQTGDFAGAIAQFQEAVRIDPKNLNAHYNLGVLFANENKYEAAISHLQAVLAINANDQSARFLLAQQLLKSNRPDEALTEFSRIVDIEPENEEALLEQAKLLLRMGNYRAARESLEKAHARQPNRVPTGALLAYVLAASPQYDLRDGARALELAQRIYQKTGSINHGAIVAMALAELGRCEEAAALLRTLINKAGDGQADLLARLRKDLSRYEHEKPCRPTP